MGLPSYQRYSENSYVWSFLGRHGFVDLHSPRTLQSALGSRNADSKAIHMDARLESWGHGLKEARNT